MGKRDGDQIHAHLCCTRCSGSRRHLWLRLLIQPTPLWLQCCHLLLLLLLLQLVLLQTV